MINKARAVHHILMGAATVGLTVLATELSKLALLNLSHDPTLRGIIIGVLGTAVSAGIGIFIAEFMHDPTPNDPPSDYPDIPRGKV